ncbi:hypothetical protein BV25DRAFT_1832801 [Artomyces pyxidatus]|uniref:Uncharacterized protein n=1 Tax=Artomyces pyxidatus TaxID=48021 RepID=A0ACB8SHY6_9AGAM|nr:hypothetical protein BV25DRAFT_1832801 [Artomyces pyxidatus]
MFRSERPVLSSPSVAIEKGAYRLHGRTPRRTHLRGNPALRKDSGASETARVSIRYERRMAFLVVFLALAATASFGLAWMLAMKGKRVAQ